MDLGSNLYLLLPIKWKCMKHEIFQGHCMVLLNFKCQVSMSSSSNDVSPSKRRWMVKLCVQDRLLACIILNNMKKFKC